MAEELQEGSLQQIVEADLPEGADEHSEYLAEAQEFEEEAEALQLDETVLITIVGSTTASVAALFVVVAKYLFPPRT